MLCQSECACLNQKVNIVVFFTKNNENMYPKGRALMPMYIVVPQTKRECLTCFITFFCADHSTLTTYYKINTARFLYKFPNTIISLLRESIYHFSYNTEALHKTLIKASK